MGCKVRRWEMKDLRNKNAGVVFVIIPSDKNDVRQLCAARHHVVEYGHCHILGGVYIQDSHFAENMIQD
uniref:hypothetical protein n=1 Tax=Thalassospira alkalitolerans TaxID=1293890 RepID=UPI0030EF4F6B